MSPGTDILNLFTICRCCHTDGNFKDLRVSCKSNNRLETYRAMLQETLNIDIMPALIKASYTICDDCIIRLRDAAQFKTQVILCEEKFSEYCKNELTSGIQNDETNKSDKIEFNYEIEITCDTDDIREDDCDDKKKYVKAVEEELKQESKASTKKKKIRKSDKKCNVKTIEKELKEESKEATKKKIVRKKPIPPEFDSSCVLKVKTESGTMYSCKTCGGNYKTYQLLKRHILNNHSKEGYTCEHCKKTFENPSSLRNHRKSHNEFKCPDCPKTVKTIYALRYHVNSHTKSIRYQCDYCLKEFLCKSTLRVHIKGHLGTKKKCMCYLCGHWFNDVTNMAIHIRTVHEKQRPFSCHLCSRSFSAKKHLVVHVRKHTGERPFECAKCLKCFYTLFESKNHKCGDQDLRVYKCKVCSKEFSGRGNFATHVRRSHKGEKPHKCTFCGKDFTCRYSMKRHELTHSGIKPFACSYCSMKFSQKVMVTRHVKRIHLSIVNPSEAAKKVQEQCPICKRVVLNLDKHNLKCHGDTKFVCDICDKSYAENTALNRHKRIVHLGLNYKCDYCKKKYQQRNKLIKHQLKAHNFTVKTEVDFEESVSPYQIGNESYISNNGNKIEVEGTASVAVGSLFAKKHD